MSTPTSNTLSSSDIAASKWAGAASVTSLSTGKTPAPKPTPGSGLSSSRYATAAPQGSVSKNTGLGKSKYASCPPKKSVEGTSKNGPQSVSPQQPPFTKPITNITQPVPVPHQAASQHIAASSKWANAATVISLSTGKKAGEKTDSPRGLQSSRWASAPVEEEPAVPTTPSRLDDGTKDVDKSEWSEGLKLLAEMNRSNREKVFGSAKNGSIQMLKSRWADPEVKEQKSEEYEKMMEVEKKTS